MLSYLFLKEGDHFILENISKHHKKLKEKVG